MKILQVLSALFLLLSISYAYADRPLPGSSPEGFRVEHDLKTVTPDLPPSVLTYDVDGKILAFVVKNPDGIREFRFGDKCYLRNGSPVKFIREAVSSDTDPGDTQVYVEYTGGVQLDPRLRSIKADFCPDHAVVIMPLKDYLAFGKIASRMAEEKKYL